MHSIREFHIALGEWIARQSPVKLLQQAAKVLTLPYILFSFENSMRTPPLIRTKDEVKLKIELLEVRTVLHFFS
jgi:hypothetical protein